MHACIIIDYEKKLKEEEVINKPTIPTPVRIADWFTIFSAQRMRNRKHTERRERKRERGVESVSVEEE